MKNSFLIISELSLQIFLTQLYRNNIHLRLQSYVLFVGIFKHRILK